jgi:hypothetical protein
MHIKVTKIINFDKIPEEVESSIDSIQAKIDQMYSLYENVPAYESTILADDVIEKLEQIRKHMIDMDYMIEDIQTIISGHKKLTEKLNSGENINQEEIVNDQTDTFSS